MTASLRRSGGPATPPQLPIAHKLTDDTPIGYPIDIDGGTRGAGVDANWGVFVHPGAGVAPSGVDYSGDLQRDAGGVAGDDFSERDAVQDFREEGSCWG